MIKKPKLVLLVGTSILSISLPFIAMAEENEKKEDKKEVVEPKKKRKLTTVPWVRKAIIHLKYEHTLD